MLWNSTGLRRWLIALGVAALLAAKWAATSQPEALTPSAASAARVAPSRAEPPGLFWADERLTRLEVAPAPATTNHDIAVRPVVDISGCRPHLATGDEDPTVIREIPDDSAPYPQTAIDASPSSPGRMPIPDAMLQVLPSKTPVPVAVQPVAEDDWASADPQSANVPPAPSQVRLKQAQPEAIPEHLAPESSSQVMEPITALARRHVQQGFALGERGAIYSARREFVQALRIVAQSVDSKYNRPPNGPDACSQALSRALKAIQEANDFVPQGSSLDGEIDLARIIASHRTPVCQTQVPRTQIAALRSYFDYAQQQFVLAAAGNPAASQALSGLGKCCLIAEATDSRLACAKAMVFHQAALVCDAGNHLAANELGVLCARFGQWEESKRVFLQSLRIHNDAVTWQNLAAAHRQLGEQELERLALAEAERARQQTLPNVYSAVDGSAKVVWVDPQAFGGPPEDALVTGKPATAAHPPAAKTASQAKTATNNKSWWMPWR